MSHRRSERKMFGTQKSEKQSEFFFPFFFYCVSRVSHLTTVATLQNPPLCFVQYSEKCTAAKQEAKEKV